MKTKQFILKNEQWTSYDTNIISEPQINLLFGSRHTIENNKNSLNEFRIKYPNSIVVTCSTAGNIIDDQLIDDTIVATCVEFNKTTVKAKSFRFGTKEIKDFGVEIANYFKADDLAYLLLLSNMGINAGNLLKGINSIYQGKIPVSGGVAGDDKRFEKTLVGIDDDIQDDQITAIGFYSKDLNVSHGSKGGWDTFGPIRKITKCNENVLYEIDHKPVLDLYKEYLGDKAKDLPASGLLFPFAIIDEVTKEPVVRGIQNIDEKSNSLILYGDVSEGQNIQLMRANFDDLISGAGDSANETFLHQKKAPELAILISCVARRIVLGQLTEEELNESKKTLGENCTICGFYSYSELSPVIGDNACHLHNQTMTITTLSEN